VPSRAAQLTAGIVISTVAAAIDLAAPQAAQIDQAIDAYLDLITGEPQMTLTFSSPSLGERVVRAQRDGLERFAEFVVSVMNADAAGGAADTPISIERAYMLVSGLRETVVPRRRTRRRPSARGGRVAKPSSRPRCRRTRLQPAADLVSPTRPRTDPLPPSRRAVAAPPAATRPARPPARASRARRRLPCIARKQGSSQNPIALLMLPTGCQLSQKRTL